MADGDNEFTEPVKGDHPLSAPDDVRETIPYSHQAFDNDEDFHDWYDAGGDSASGHEDPGHRGILHFDPKKNGGDRSDDSDDTLASDSLAA
jgi:hypothetical protein